MEISLMPLLFCLLILPTDRFQIFILKKNTNAGKMLEH